MTTKRTNINQEGEKDEGQQAELNRPYRGIGSGHRGRQEKLDAKDSSDKNEALKRLEAKLEPVIRFFNGNAPENVNAIFGSKEAIEEYKQSIGDEAVASLRLYTEANEKDMRKYGIPTIKEQLNKILERLTSHIE